MCLNCQMLIGSTGHLLDHLRPTQHQQRRFNKLVEERIQEHFARFGPASDCPDLKELVESFCCMHLAVNLRKAFFNAEESSLIMLRVMYWFTNSANF